MALIAHWGQTTRVARCRVGHGKWSDWRLGAYLERVKIDLNATFGALRGPILDFTPLHTILVDQKKRSYIGMLFFIKSKIIDFSHFLSQILDFRGFERFTDFAEDVRPLGRSKSTLNYQRQ